MSRFIIQPETLLKSNILQILLEKISLLSYTIIDILLPYKKEIYVYCFKNRRKSPQS